MGLGDHHCKEVARGEGAPGAENEGADDAEGGKEGGEDAEEGKEEHGDEAIAEEAHGGVERDPVVLGGTAVTLAMKLKRKYIERLPRMKLD